MNDKARLFYDIGEPYAAGLFEDTPSVFARYARAQRRYWEALPTAGYNGEPLYPSGRAVRTEAALVPDYSFTYGYNAAEMQRKSPGGAALLADMLPELPRVSHPHDVGGNMYTHSIPNFGRVAREGLDSYALRAAECPDKAFAAGIADLIAGLRDYHARSVAMLRESGADGQLIDALERVPFRPARNIREAIVCFNFIWYADGCDNVGMLDTELEYFHRGEDVTGLLRAYFTNVDANSGWTGALGPRYSPLTVMCLRAVAGLRRPSLELRLADPVPDGVWEAAADAIMSGCGQPSFYNEALYQSALSAALPGVPREDLLRFCGGGCTESMLSGISNVGSLDAGINAALVFCEYMNANLPKAGSFDAFYSGLLDTLRGVVAGVLEEINRARAVRASLRPQPVRTLFVDDCIDRGLDFNNGGARWSWSVVNIAGMINVIDSLLAVRALVFDGKKYSASEFLRRLNAHDGVLFGEFTRCPRYGVDDRDADTLARDFTAALFGFFSDIKPVGGEAFLPSSIQFTTYADAGRHVGATPDGRRGGDCLCDSIGAVHNRDTAGPTALLNSAARLAQPLAAGTPVMNIRIAKDHVRQALKPLVAGYFKSGGMQLQLTCVSKDEIAEALDNPEAHPNLIVRIGGYSEYFRNLTPELRRSVYERTEY